ncbi:hypothetical protein [Azospirillum sp. SYSU D00513]|uniref:hypothetical protein n=1 Tax=Azospirillum sp. SYSU D00513 TaxID=2812561 RepID=UPI001A96F416|nr:hypothetical protein [Azospirillum sp. SYSU D00513]
MGPFLVAIRPWGLHLEVRPPLSAREAEEFNALFEAACATLAHKGPGWGALSDIRTVDIASTPRDSIVWYMHLARQCGAERTASIHADGRAAAVYAAALRDAGIAERHRILVVPDGDPDLIQQAFRWVQDGVEPSFQHLTEGEAGHRNKASAVQPGTRIPVAEIV